MTQSFIGQITAFAFNYPPKYWALCDGQIMAINQNQALFSLLGTAYGGNGQSTFALPDLRSRVPIGVDAAGVYPLGYIGGEAAVVLAASQMPLHNHLAQVNSSAAASSNVNSPTVGLSLGQAQKRASDGTESPINMYSDNIGNVPSALGGSTGGGAAHENRQPYNVVNFCICLNGIFPSRN
jgi:microcystin-dependent protein